jgi:protein-disulfide isomerase
MPVSPSALGALAAITICAWPAQGQQAPDALLEARAKGSPAAPITMYEIADFQCPACRTFWRETLPVLEREYIATGRVRLVFINLPLESIHPNALPAHEVAMCAARQGRFWPVHDLLFKHQGSWARAPEPLPILLALADSAGAAQDTLAACIRTGATRGLIQAEALGVQQAGIRSTPSFLVEGALIPGAAPIEAWRPILDSIYAERRRARGNEDE